MPTYHMPAGTYYFGDPCYVIRETWTDVLEDTDFMEDFTNTQLVLRAGSTAHGDGTYMGNDRFSGHQFGVDAGLLGFVPVNEMTVSPEYAADYGSIIEMNEPFRFETDNGVYSVNGTVIVDTSSYEDLDDYEHEYSSEYDEYEDEME